MLAATHRGMQSHYLRLQCLGFCVDASRLGLELLHPRLNKVERGRIALPVKRSGVVEKRLGNAVHPAMMKTTKGFSLSARVPSACC